ncbi:MAG: hypothetical protein VSS75_011465 [Candidatus Parabeggiatoa sp.]|nr:hypothetical protein [Candidatus Parabeggiatoa sp.]
MLRVSFYEPETRGIASKRTGDAKHRVETNRRREASRLYIEDIMIGGKNFKP